MSKKIMQKTKNTIDTNPNWKFFPIAILMSFPWEARKCACAFYKPVSKCIKASKRTEKRNAFGQSFIQNLKHNQKITANSSVSVQVTCGGPVRIREHRKRCSPLFFSPGPVSYKSISPIKMCIVIFFLFNFRTLVVLMYSFSGQCNQIKSF